MSLEAPIGIFGNQENIDFVSGLPYWFTSYLLDNILPTSALRRMTKDSIKSEQVLCDFFNLAKNDDLREQVTMLCSGSLFEGLHLPYIIKKPLPNAVVNVAKPDEDVMFIYKTSKVGGRSYGYDLILVTDDSHPGYTKVAVSPHIEANRISNKVTTVKFQNGQPVRYAQNNQMMPTVFKHKGETISEIHGPANTLFGNLAPKTFRGELHDTIESVDHVFSLHCPDWPSVAVEWISRPRSYGWPSKDLILDAQRTGCHLVPVCHHRSKDPDLEWRISFSAVEKMLSKSLPFKQRQVYLLFKAILRFKLDQFSFLSTYNFKTIFFWALENSPPHWWTTNTMTTGFFYLLDRLKVALLRHNMPNYFIPENNMIDHVAREAVTSALCIIDNIRRHPLRTLQMFLNMNTFVVHCRPFNIQNAEDIIFPLQYLVKTPTISPLFIADFSEELLGMAQHHFLNRSFLEAIETFYTYSRLSILDQREEDVGPWLFTDVVPSDYAITMIKIGEHMISRDDQLSDYTIDCILFRLAELNHVCAFHVKEHEKEHYLVKARQLYETLLETEHFDHSLRMRHLCKFANLLLFVRELSKAKSYLKQIITHANADDEVSFGVDFKYTLDSYLHAEVSHDSDLIIIPCRHFAQYLLIKCCVLMQDEGEALQTVEQFRYDLECILVTYDKNMQFGEFTWSLLGYSYMVIGNYQKAHEAFKTAAARVNDSDLALQNQQFCRDKIGETLQS